MFEIAGGVVLGGLILYVLYEFREEIAKLLLWPFWGTIAALALWLLGAVVVGGWRTVERVASRTKGRPTIPEGLFAWAVLIGLFVLVGEASDGFSNTRSLVKRFRGRPNR